MQPRSPNLYYSTGRGFAPIELNDLISEDRGAQLRFALSAFDGELGKFALTHVARLVGHCPAEQGVTVLIPLQGTNLGYGLVPCKNK